jgi:hypothetical protein
VVAGSIGRFLDGIDDEADLTDLTTAPTHRRDAGTLRSGGSETGVT